MLLIVHSRLLVDDLMAGKRVYLTASTAREHTNKLWEQEGKNDLVIHFIDGQEM